MTITELLADPNRWTQRAEARDSDGSVVNPLAENAEQFCLYGAVAKCYGTLRLDTDVHHKLGLTLKAMGVDESYITWQDHPWRTHAEVLDLVTKAGV